MLSKIPRPGMARRGGDASFSQISPILPAIRPQTGIFCPPPWKQGHRTQEFEIMILKINDYDPKG